MLGNSQVIQRATRATTALPSIVLNSYVYDIIHIVLLRRSTCRDDQLFFTYSLNHYLNTLKSQGYFQYFSQILKKTHMRLNAFRYIGLHLEGVGNVSDEKNTISRSFNIYAGFVNNYSIGGLR